MVPSCAAANVVMIRKDTSKLGVVIFLVVVGIIVVLARFLTIVILCLQY